MTVAEAVIDKLQTPPAEDQQKVLQFVESLANSKHQPAERKNPRGLFADRGVHISAADTSTRRAAKRGGALVIVGLDLFLGSERTLARLGGELAHAVEIGLAKFPR